MAQLGDSEYDADLRSVQEARRLAVACRKAQREFAHASQAEVDRVCAAMAEAVHRDAARLGQLACDETGYGVPAHKKIKIEFGSMAVWESIRDIPTVGVLRRDPAQYTRALDVVPPPKPATPAADPKQPAGDGFENFGDFGGGF